MKTIYRYPIEWNGFTTVKIPRGAKILHAGTQYGHMGIWAVIDTEIPWELRKFLSVGTGYDLTDINTDNMVHIGSVSLNDSYMYHIFDAGIHQGDENGYEQSTRRRGFTARFCDAVDEGLE